MLVGIKYVSIFPKEIHTLPSGLTIYSSRLASHDGKFNACLGGPHSSFAALASGAGGVTQLLAHFVDGLQSFKDTGPPRIKSVPMSKDEIGFVRDCLVADGELCEIMDHDKRFSYELKNNLDELNSDDELLAQKVVDDERKVCCSHCEIFENIHEKIFENSNIADHFISNDERIADFKRHQNIHESGLEIDYRCPKCRDCVECKSADKTEKISLKEESEMFEIRKSIQLDFENKTIQSTLPLKGKERDFLSSNRDRAIKVLKQQPVS